MTERPSRKSEPPTAERRQALREQSFVLAQVTCPSGKERLGAIADASATGLALLIRSEIEVGDVLEVEIELDGEARLEVAGEVVRREETPPDGPWWYRVGLRIDPPSEALREHAARIRERYEAVWARQRERAERDPE